MHLLTSVLDSEQVSSLDLISEIFWSDNFPMGGRCQNTELIGTPNVAASTCPIGQANHSLKPNLLPFLHSLHLHPPVTFHLTQL